MNTDVREISFNKTEDEVCSPFDGSAVDVQLGEKDEILDDEDFHNKDSDTPEDDELEEDDDEFEMEDVEDFEDEELLDDDDDDNNDGPDDFEEEEF